MNNIETFMKYSIVIICTIVFTASMFGEFITDKERSCMENLSNIRQEYIYQFNEFPASDWLGDSKKEKKMADIGAWWKYRKESEIWKGGDS